MSHREVLEALSGLLIGMFVAMLSSTVVTNALPTIIGDLGGGESAYTWVITATLLTTTATTPIWGKLADLFSRKMLVQVALVIFVAGSAMAGLAPGIGWLIGARAVQGIGVGGLTALVQVVMAAMIAPRERGRYSGYLGATFALATISGPLLGGLIVDTSWLGWRWCFFVGAPFALLAFVVLQKTLHLPVVRREGVSIDYLGATLIVGGVSTLLIWVSLAGHQFAWGSTADRADGGRRSAAARPGGLAGGTRRRADHPAAAVPRPQHRPGHLRQPLRRRHAVRRHRLPQPVLPDLARQEPHGRRPDVAADDRRAGARQPGGRAHHHQDRSLQALDGRRRRARHSGLLLLGTIDAHTPFWVVGVWMAILGLGLGATMQNLVLAVQNTVGQSELGAASSTVVVLPVARRRHRGLRAGRPAGSPGHVPGRLRPDPAGRRPPRPTAPPAASRTSAPCPRRCAHVVEDAYGVAVAARLPGGGAVRPAGLVAIIAMTEVPLRRTLDLDPADTEPVEAHR